MNLIAIIVPRPRSEPVVGLSRNRALGPRLAVWMRAGFAAALTATCIAAVAQTYPARAMRVIVPTAPGSSTDISARLVAPHMERSLGQPMLVDNRPGANSTIAANAVAKAPADGYMLYFGSSTSIHPLLNKNGGVDVARDFTAISNVMTGSLFFISSARLPARTFPELLAYSRANPGKLNLGAGGTSATLQMGMLKERVGLTYTSIPYKGSAPALAALVAGEVDFLFTPLEGKEAQLKAGTIRALFAASPQRYPGLPDVPTSAEVGVPNYVWQFSFGFWGPTGLSKDVAQKLNVAAVATAKLPQVVQAIRESAASEPVGSTPEEQLRAHEDQMRTLREAARLVNFQPE